VRNCQSGQEEHIKESKLLQIKDLRQIIHERFGVEPSLQRLIFQGKQLENVSDKGQNLTIFDYSVSGNGVIQLMPRQVLKESNNIEAAKVEPEKEKRPEVQEQQQTNPEEESEFKAGSYVDVKCPETEAYFIAIIQSVSRDENNKVQYNIKFTEYEGVHTVPEDSVRNIARQKLELADIKVDDRVFVNYNFEDPDSLGFWWDAKVETVKRTTRTVICTINKKEGCKVTNLEIYKSEGPDFTEMDCDKCKKNPKRKCKDCGCRKCGGKDKEDTIMMCDECNDGYHMECLGLSSLPEEDEWFCPRCKNENNIIAAGGKAMAARERKQGSTRDWGRGQATEGRTKECNIVPKDHFGPIPGVEVGMCWQYRIQVSEEGIHRPHVAGIAGSAKGVMEKRGCQSIVLSGGYEDDTDYGDSFLYTGSGGRDLSGNKRTAAQSSDQTLDRYNEAIAYSCVVRPVTTAGANAGDKWREGKPVRVTRAWKAKKHSDFAPEEGFRYDGIYKVKRYWQETGRSSFKVWRYEFIRDDPSPAPWTEEGKAIIEREGYTCIMRDPEQNKKTAKRKNSDDDDHDENEAPKKARKQYEINPEWRAAMDKDTRNKKMWDQVLEKELYSRMDLLDQVKEVLTCQICFELPNQQVTTECGHNICGGCLRSSFEAENFKCPSCRHDLGEDMDTNNVNRELEAVLNILFPRA